MNFDSEDISFSDLETFLREQQEVLKQDKLSLGLQRNKNCLQAKSGSSGSSVNKNGEVKSIESKKEESIVNFNNILKQSKMVKTQQLTHSRTIPLSPREKEKEKLIREFSKPLKKETCTRKRAVKTKLPSHPTSVKTNNFTTDIREKEKDRLAEIFASSEYQYSKPSNYELSKNLNSELGVGNKQYNVVKLLNTERVNNQRTDNIPTIFVTEHEIGDKTKPANINTEEDKAMVGIGEYSPHNPKLPISKPVLGVGEYDARRILLQDQRRQEYNQYLEQMCRSASRSREAFNYNHQLKEVGTQTEWDDEVLKTNEEVAQIPYSMDPAKQKLSNQQNQPSQCRLSPVPSCFEGLTEKEIKEYLYREELRKQIEEKYRLKEEMRKKEEEEEAKVEERIQRDLEKMRKQYEEERLQRLELAIRKKEQEELLGQRLAAEQRKATRESKVKKVQLMANKSTSPRETVGRSTVGRRFCEQQTVVPLSHSLPVTCASKALADVHEELRKPLLEIQDKIPSKVPLRNASASNRPVPSLPSASSPPLPTHKRSRDVDILVNRTVFDSQGPDSPKQSDIFKYIPSSRPSRNTIEKMKEVDSLLKQPLLPEHYQTLPVSPPLLHATIPPTTSVNPPVPASQTMHRTGAGHLEEYWKGPDQSQNAASSSDVVTRHNRSVLTQLGAFRRHLQEERQRMRERVRDESP